MNACASNELARVEAQMDYVYNALCIAAVYPAKNINKPSTSQCLNESNSRWAPSSRKSN